MIWTRGIVMLQIAVCDDEKVVTKKIREIVEQHFLDLGKDVQVKEFWDGSELVETGEHFDFIFLDVEMKMLNGIETAKQIRKFDGNVPIVYITEYTDYWRRAYTVHAFDFIEKPADEERIHQVLQDWLNMIQESKNQTVELLTEDGMIIQKTDEIYYFLINRKKKVLVCTGEKQYFIRENLADIYSKLNQVQFYSPHRSCIVNLKYIEKLDGYDIILENGEFLPLAQKKKKEYLEQLHRYIKGKRNLE